MEMGSVELIGCRTHIGMVTQSCLPALDRDASISVVEFDD
jgi:hypothetical protein